MTGPAAAPALDRCPTCGEAIADDPRCARCGTSLLVDVVLDAADARARFLAARVASGALAGVSFARAKAALDRGAPLATGLSRAAARALLAALAAQGIAASAAPGAAATGRRREGGGLGAVARLAGIAAVVIAVGGGAAWFATRTSTSNAIATPTTNSPQTATELPASSPDQAAGSGRAPFAARTDASAGRSEVPPALSTAALARAAKGALASLRCEDKLGSGFFVDGEHLLTNAHVVCGTGSTVTAKLDDGRSLLGTVVAQDAWVDWAVVKVPGANVAAPLPLGDPAALEPGAPVVLAGSPHGLDATVHEGKVSHAGRNLLGVAFLQLNADVNPGNSGGPVLDARGRAVAIVTLKVVGADGIGMALPVDYARAALPGAPPASARWAEVRARVEREDAEEAAHTAERLAHPSLLAVVRAGDGLGAVVLLRARAAPGALPVVLQLRAGDATCEVAATADRWSSLEQRLRELTADGRAERTAQWMLRRGLAKDVWAGGAPVALGGGCADRLRGRVVVSLRGDAPEVELSVSGDELAAARLRAGAASRGAELASAREAASRQRAEREWRAAFSRAREQVERLEAARADMRRTIDAQTDANRTAWARRELPRVERDLARAKEALDDLEREASRGAVPREWR